MKPDTFIVSNTPGAAQLAKSASAAMEKTIVGLIGDRPSYEWLKLNSILVDRIKGTHKFSVDDPGGLGG